MREVDDVRRATGAEQRTGTAPDEACRYRPRTRYLRFGRHAEYVAKPEEHRERTECEQHRLSREPEQCERAEARADQSARQQQFDLRPVGFLGVRPTIT